MRLPGSSPAFIGLPHHSNGSTYRFFPRTRFSTGRLSGLQLFLDVQASQLARLPDRSYRCKFPHRAAEASTSEQNVRRCLRTHRTCYPPDYRQLAERGLSPRKTRSLVGCSRMMPRFPSPSLKFRTVSFPQSGFKAGISDAAFPGTLVCHRPSCFLPRSSMSRSVSGSMRLPAPPCERINRSTPGVLAPVRVMLSRSILTYLTPCAPLAGTPRLRRFATYTRCHRCAPLPRRLGSPRAVPCFR